MAHRHIGGVYVYQGLPFAPFAGHVVSSSWIGDSIRFCAVDSSFSALVMVSLYASLAALSLFVGDALAAASLPPKPADLTTPVQQRIAVNGPNGRLEFCAQTRLSSSRTLVSDCPVVVQPSRLRGTHTSSSPSRASTTAPRPTRCPCRPARPGRSRTRRRGRGPTQSP